MKKISFIIFLILFRMLPAQKVYSHIALKNGTAHIGNGKVIENSLIVIKGNLIESVVSVAGIRIDPSAFDTIIDLSGHHIYPGLINCNNVLGLHDAEAIRATLDYSEVGTINPHVRSLIAYNTDNVIVPTIKTNGVLYTQVTPRGGLLSGTSSLMALEGWNWEDAVLKEDDGVHLNFPRAVIKKAADEDETNAKLMYKKYADDLAALDKFFADAQAYCKSEVHDEKNLRFEAMCKVFQGTANLYIHADKVKDIISAVNFSKKYNIRKTVLVGGKESYKVTAELRRGNIPVMLGRINDLPDYIGDDVDIINRLPSLLQKDSVLYCIQIEGDMEAMNSRNLPFNAGAAVPYGITREQALSAITWNAAKITGVDDKVGTLETGKLASLVVSKGDILDMRTNDVILAYIAGKPVKLFNRQTELYLKYKARYGVK
jgi:hypothetical protein